jgi:4-amino-4-deoxychorismate lyase
MFVEGALRDGLGPSDGLIETFRFDPQDGFIRLDRHLARLARSAEALGFRYDPATLHPLFYEVPRNEGPLRVRLMVDQEGNAEITTSHFLPLANDTIWTLRIAETRLNSADPLLAHKTTRRGVYQKAREEFSTAIAQEVLLCNERGEVCEGTITNLFLDRGDGRLLTPPLASGLLPGVLRGELIDSGRAVERILFAHDLHDARLFVGNSLRGLIPARFAG